MTTPAAADITDAEVRSFFAAYGAAFLETEDAIAAFYGAPCMTARQGVVHLNATPADVHAFFGAVLRQYRARRLKDMDEGRERSVSWEEVRERILKDKLHGP